METILTTWDPLVAALTLVAVVFAAWAVGSWAARRRPPRSSGSPSEKYSDLVLALLGLLLAFTFSISLDQHGARRNAIVEDANAISNFHVCAELQNEPVRTHLRHHVRSYVELRMELARPIPDEAQLQGILGRVDDLHAAIQEQVRRAVTEGTPTTEPLVETFNAMTSSTASRLAARRARLPGPVMLVLVVASVLSMALLGWQGGRTDAAPAVGALAFTAIVGLVVWVTLDLNRPYAGSIQVSQEPMERLLANIRK